ncbi:MAG TPA: GNAT family N-acetyltransferase [Gemmatimonadales bacterium]|jgi:ribosomal-protein-alanine N-acetyltransferase|nr:GNAT family N-acetyltransferase [Gemmatimonadales bacterium]
MTATPSRPPGLLTQIETERLRLLSLSADAIDALLAGDAASLGRMTNARFPTPLRPPPLTEDVLPLVRDRLRADPSQDGWWTWLVVRKGSNQAVGSAGFGGGPDSEGAVMIGYATYPDVERNGFATEAATALIGWALDHPGVERVCASLPPDNHPAIRVAEKVGMRLIGTVWEEDLDEVLLYGVEKREP